MRGNRLQPPALLLSLCLAVPVTAQTLQTQPTPSPTSPTLPPRGPIGPVAPPAPPGSLPPGGAPQTPPAAPAPQPPPGPPGAGPDRLDFQLKFTGGKDGKNGSAAGSAANLEYKREDYAVLSGDVQLKYQDLDLKADEAEIDLKTKNVIALGHVILDQGPRRISGDALTFNLDSKTGTFRHATGQVAPDYYFTGEEVDKTGDNTYVIRNGVFTSCSQPVPDWSFRVRRAEIEVQGYAHAHNTSMLVKKLPVLYTPYLLWPVRTDRSSGFLVPNIGYSQRRGAELGLAYFQTPGRSYDTTFHLDTYTKGFLGLGDEFRYAPTPGTKGDFIGYYVRDPDTSSWRWKVQLNHTTEDLPWGMRGVVQYQGYSDFNFFRDFERDFNTNTLSFIDSRAFVTGNWGPHLLNLLLDSREVFLNAQNDTLSQRKLPELKYTLRSTRIANSPFYLELDSSADYLNVNRPVIGGTQGNFSGSYGRFDLFPQLTLPVRTFPWLNLSVTGGERLTWYGDTVTPDQSAFTGNSLTRNFPFASAQIIGPSFSRIFNWKLGDLGKFKHIIEPRFTYAYQGDVSKNAAEVPVFDEIDAQRAANSGRIALDNRLLGKPDKEDGVAREVLLFELARNYSFDKTQPLQTSANGTQITSAGPVEALLRFNPTQRIGFTSTASYSTLFKGLASTSFTGNYGFGAADYLGLTWFTSYNPELRDTVSNQTRVNGAVAIPGWHLRLEGQVSYNIQQHLLQNDQIAIDYTSQCFALRLEFRDFRTGTGATAGQVVSDREIRFSLSLKNVGTFLDLNSRSSTTLPQ
jgi:LPS-assembly protein